MRATKHHGTYKIALAGLMLILASMACDIDQNFPPLVVGASPITFDPWIAEIHDWHATVTPGLKYEVILSLGSAGGASHNSLFIRNADSCPDCITSADPSANPMKLSFIGPANGQVLIVFIPGFSYGSPTIQLREYGKTTIDPSADVQTYIEHINYFKIVLVMILSIFALVGFKKSHVLEYRADTYWGERATPKVNFIWLTLVIFLIGILVTVIQL